MAIKAKFLECECGALFQEEEKNTIKGETFYTPWRIIESQKIDPVSNEDSDSLHVLFSRDVCCQNCKKELVKENKKYEINPPVETKESKIISSNSFEYYSSTLN